MSREDYQGFFIEREHGSTIMVPRTHWSESLASEALRFAVDGIRLSQAAGWRDSNIDFVANFPNLRSIEIYSETVTDLSPLDSLCGLVHMGIQCAYKTFPSHLPLANLKSCGLNWHPAAKGLLQCKSLESLNITNYPFENLSPLVALTSLKVLKLTSSRLTGLDGASSLRELAVLDLYRCTRLHTLAGIEAHSTLSILALDVCKKVTSLDHLRGLRNLCELIITDCDDIESLEPIRSLAKLTRVFFVGSTKIVDGNVDLDRSLPALKDISFMNRRGYNDSREHVAERIAKRS